jgi:methionyl-tRNA formyltransferase
VLPEAPELPRRLVYLGTPEIAVPPLRALHDSGYEVALVVSRADARRGRRGHDEPSPVKAAARDLGLPVTDRLDDVLDVRADLGIVAAYGRIVPTRVLEQLPMINIHYSLLPRWRGAAPVERAILAGDRQTGVCIMAVEEGLDTGGVYAQRTLEIGEHETADELRARLASCSVELLLGCLRNGLGAPRPQTGEPTYADKIDPSELELRWDRPAVELERVVRVGGAWTTFHGRRLKVWAAGARSDHRLALAPGGIDPPVVGTGDGVLELQEVQVEGKPRRPAAEWFRGARLTADDRLGS